MKGSEYDQGVDHGQCANYDQGVDYVNMIVIKILIIFNVLIV